ncbi:cysteine--tRNA ligase [bacterium]|nr:cysteine--tRNA ligase [bacterium]
MRVYNTLSGKKEDFITIEPNKVGMYVCGVTVYDYCHVGHARAYVAFDAIYRYLKYKNYDVTYVRNFTDVDDKIIKRANESDSSSKEVSETFINAFHEDMEKLSIASATIEPKATEHISDMIEMISELISKNLAYESDGDVYFSVSEFPEYGKLSNRKLDELMSGVRIEISEQKKNPLDFALWKKAKPNEPMWDSPWGKGRPGWHIECSAMSTKYLGATFDIHGGGKDLVFPHHENEVAQSEGATGQEYVKYWLHNGFVNIDGAKMSKSLGNFFTIRHLLEKYDPEVIRFFILSNHYRSPINFTIKKDDENDSEITFVSLDETEDRLCSIYETLSNMFEIIDNPIDDGELLHPEYKDSILAQFEADMDDDFNTAAAIGTLSKYLRVINELIDRPKTKLKDKKRTLKEIYSQLKDIFSTLALFESNPSQFLSKINEKRANELGLTKEYILSKIEERNSAKKNKNYEEADKIREELLSQGVSLKDYPDRVKWSIIKKTL